MPVKYMECTMTLKLKDIFQENVSERGQIDEGLWNAFKTGFAKSLKSLIKMATATPEERNAVAQAKQAEKVLGMLKKAKSFGVKKLGGSDLDKVISELEGVANILKKDKNNTMGSDKLTNILQGLQTRSTSSSRPTRKQNRFGKLPERVEGRYSLKKLFIEQTNPAVDRVQNQKDLSYNHDSPKADNETVVQDAANKAPIMSDEEILSGLRDDVANYGEFDAVLGDEDNE
jgi:hypothetical protein